MSGGDRRSDRRHAGELLGALDQVRRALEPVPLPAVAGVDLVADLDDPVRVRRRMEADPADHRGLGAGDRGADQPPVVVALADLVPAELEHVAALGGPCRRVVDPDVLPEDLPAVGDHVLDDRAGKRDQRQPAGQQDVVKLAWGRHAAMLSADGGTTLFLDVVGLNHQRGVPPMMRQLSRPIAPTI